jgi:hypothetical protein
MLGRMSWLDWELRRRWVGCRKGFTMAVGGAEDEVEVERGGRFISHGIAAYGRTCIKG